MPEATEQFTLQECRELLHSADAEKMWPKISALLFRFQEQIDPSRIEAILKGLPCELLTKGTAGCRKRLAEYVLETFGIRPFLYDFPKENGSRLFLLSPQCYRAFGQRLELLSHEKQLRGLIRKEDVLQWKERYPGIYPEILRRTAFYTPWLPKLATLPQVPHAGMRLIATILHALPQELLRRQPFRFPEEMAEAFTPFTEEEWRGEASDLKMLLTVLKHEFSQEYSSLCF